VKRAWTVRVCTAAALIALGGLVQTVAFVRRVDIGGVLGGEVQSDLSEHDRRFAKLRERLASETSVGYLVPLPITKLIANPIQAAFFFQAQYSLAPVQVVATISPARVIADLQALAHFSAVFEADDGDVMIILPTVDMGALRLEENLRQDVLLYRRKQP
jgi:hypothetical protein